MSVTYFLAGGSYPKDRHVEDALASRLRPAGVSFVSHPDFTALAGGEPRTHSVAERLEQLERVLARSEGEEPPFLIGRSSGCIVATLASLRFPLAGVICLSYPFRQPGRALEPARFAHLADVTCPTLIIQGDTDRYGGLEVTQDYVLSPKVALRFVVGRHRLELSEDVWDRVAGWIFAFMSGGGIPPNGAFDEDFYLGAHRDVAAAVRQGSLRSGLEHFEQVGRRERRTYRLLSPVT